MDRTIKVVLAGDTLVGKTAWVLSLQCQAFTSQRVQTLGVEVTPYEYLSTLGPLHFSIWDISGNPLCAGLSEGYALGADAAILMVDPSSYPSLGVASRWKRTLQHMCPHIPIVTVYNKSDLLSDAIPTVQPKADSLLMSVKLNTNTKTPLETLAALLPRPKITYVENEDDFYKDSFHISYS
jgi:small GTP-binding protein